MPETKTFGDGPAECAERFESAHPKGTGVLNSSPDFIRFCRFLHQTDPRIFRRPLPSPTIAKHPQPSPTIPNHPPPYAPGQHPFNTTSIHRFPAQTKPLLDLQDRTVSIDFLLKQSPSWTSKTVQYPSISCSNKAPPGLPRPYSIHLFPVQTKPILDLQDRTVSTDFLFK